MKLSATFRRARPTDVSPVGLAAAIHLGIADGKPKPGEAVGLGVEYDDEVGSAHAYAPAYLPVARLLDGSMHNW